MLYTAKESFQFNRRGIRINPGDVIELSDEELKDFSKHPDAFELVPGQKKIGRPKKNKEPDETDDPDENQKEPDETDDPDENQKEPDETDETSED